MSMIFKVNEYKKDIWIGHDPTEHLKAQQVIFDVQVQLYSDALLLCDTWEPVYDYCTITTIIDQCCEQQIKILQEPLAWQVCKGIFENKKVKKVRVYLEKTQRYEGTRSIGFELDLNRKQFNRIQAQIDKIEPPKLQHPNELLRLLGQTNTPESS